MAEFDEILVGSPRWQSSDIQVGLTQLLCSSLAATVGARAGRSHGMRGWSIGLLGKKSKERKGLISQREERFLAKRENKLKPLRSKM